MITAQARFPDVFRYAKSELKPARLVFGAVASLVTGCCMLVTVAAHSDGALRMFQFVLGIQGLILLGYGTARTAGSIIAERQEGTWDLQRLTPLSPFQLAMGKLAGAPLFAAYLAATLLPWALACFFFPKPLEPGIFAIGYLGLLAGAFMALSVGLVISAYSAESVGGNYSSTTGVLAGIFAVQSFLPIVASADSAGHVPFFGWELPPAALWSLSASCLGAWAFLGAKWRIGRDLLEGPRWWRLPAFLVFIVVYELGWVATRANFPFGVVMLAPALFVYMSAVLNAEGSDHWKRWLARSEAGSRWHRVPVWVNGCESYAVLAVASLAYAGGAADNDWRLYPLLQAVFMARDLMFLQWCRLRGWRRPEVVALVSLGFAYALPAVFIGTFGGWSERFVYVPVPNAEFGAVVNLLPGVLQAGAMAWLLSRRLRPALARA